MDRANIQLAAAEGAQVGSGKATTVTLITLQAPGDITFPITSTPEHLLICSPGLTSSALCFRVLKEKISQRLILEK